MRGTAARGQDRKVDGPRWRITSTGEAVEGEEPWDGRVLWGQRARSRGRQAVERSWCKSGDGPVLAKR